MLRLRLLGGASIETADGPVAGRAAQRRRLALLAILSASRGAVSRDKLMSLLWPESDAERARHLLSDSLYRINQELGGEVVQSTTVGLWLNPERLPADLGDFEAALAAGRDADAVAGYGGPFLDGFFLTDSVEFDSWADDQRTRLAQDFAGALSRLAEGAEVAADWPAAVAWWRRLAAHDRHNARVACRLMLALDAAGERAAALQHAGVFQRLLTEELEVDPDPDVTELASRLRQTPAEPRLPGLIPVAEEAAPGRATVAEAESARQPAAGAFRGVVAAGLVVIAALAGTWWWRGRPAATDRAAERNAIVVLPFADLSVAQDAGHLSDGIAEELLTSLGKVPSLRVVAWTSAQAMKGKPTDVRELGRVFQAGWVVEGSVRQEADRLRVAVRLIDARDGLQIWSEDFDRELGSAFAIEREIATAVVTRLRGAGAAQQLARPAPVDYETYALYLRGRYLWHQRTEASLRAAVESFAAAVKRTPGYAPAHAGLGDAYAVLGFYDMLPPGEAFPKAREAATRAIALDPRLAAPHATLGYVDLYYEWDLATAESEFRRSIALDGSYSTAHQWLANLLTAAGRFPEAEQAMRRAQELDPLSLIANGALGWVYLNAGRFAEAEAQCRRTLELNSQFYVANLWMGQAAGAAGRDSVARTALHAAVDQSNRGDIEVAELAYAHARWGETDSTRAILAELGERERRGRYVPSYEIAKVHVALGEYDQAREWLRRALRERSHSIVFLKVDPELAPARSLPWWSGFLAETGLP